MQCWKWSRDKLRMTVAWIWSFPTKSLFGWKQSFGLPTYFSKDLAILLPVGHLIHLTRHVFTLPHANGSDYLKQKCPELFQEIISFLIPFLESIQFDPAFGELGVCAKLSSAWGPWCFNLSNTTAETTLLCVFMDKRHCNCISSRPANELFNHLHMDVL